MGVGGQRHAPSALPPEKTGNPLYRKLGEHQDRSGRVRKISPLPGFEPRRPAFSEPLYLLSYPGPPYTIAYSHKRKRFPAAKYRGDVFALLYLFL
jgi:hypothetical protein